MDEFFFHKWSPRMAYVLGFWFADGYMRIDKSYRIGFASKDKEILSKIRNCLKSTHPIRKDRDCWRITFYSKEMYREILALGGLRRKSTVVKFPKIPSVYLRDFIRGYFDGDGSVFFVKYARSKDGRFAKELRTNFTSGSKEFLESLMKILTTELGLSLKMIGVFNNGGSLKLGYGMKDSDTLLRYMYYDKFPIGLERKATFVSRIPEYQRHS